MSGPEGESRECGETEKPCVFCRIIKREVPASVVDESAHLIVFMSLEGYPLIVPKVHVENFLDKSLKDDVAKEIGLLQREIAQATIEAFGTDSVTIISTSGRHSGQDIGHLH